MEEWGLVLSGGGAKGAYQLGVLKALKEKGYLENIKAVSGASIGSLNAISLAAGDIEKIIKAWKKVNLLTVFDTELEKIDGVEGFALRDGMLKLIRDNIDYEKVINCHYPVYASLSKIINENEFLVEYKKLNGESYDNLEKIIEASSAMPIIYEAVEINGVKYRDGGLSDNVPIKPVYDEGNRNIILLCLNKDQKKYEYKYSDVNFLSIYPSRDLGDLSGTLNFTHKFIEFAIKLGYKDGLRNIDAYENHLSESTINDREKSDYEQIMRELNQDKIEQSVNKNLNAIDDLINKHNVF